MAKRAGWRSGGVAAALAGWLLTCHSLAAQQLLPPQGAAPPPPPPPGVNLGRPVPLAVEQPPPGVFTQPVPDAAPFDEMRPIRAVLDYTAGNLSLDYWHIGTSEIEGTPSELTLNQLGIAYEFRVPTDFFLLKVQPEFDVWFLGGPTRGPELPPQVYGLSVTLEGNFVVTERLGIKAAIMPGLYTDFTNFNDAFRVPALLVASWVYDPNLILIGGIVYTAQPDLPVLPAIGAIWTPSQEWRLELIAPRPKAIYKFRDGLDVYGQFGLFGGTFAVRSDGEDDLLQYRDWRLAVGAEWTTAAQAKVFFEFGGAFWRSLELERREFDVDPGFYFRVGSKF